ncbi:MAG TPA: hypothetical protein VKY24_22655 [Reyranella sp.]|nr:hypothetical protein [Reyranella sp.]
MAADLDGAAAAAKNLAIDAKARVSAEAGTIWRKIVGLFNRCWVIAAAATCGYALGVMHALGTVF